MPHHCPCQLDPLRRRQAAHHDRNGLVTRPQRLRGQVGADLDHAADRLGGVVAQEQGHGVAPLEQARERPVLPGQRQRTYTEMNSSSEMSEKRRHLFRAVHLRTVFYSLRSEK